MPLRGPDSNGSSLRLRRFVRALVPLAVVPMLSTPSMASEFNVILANLTDLKNPAAWIEVSNDLRGAPEGVEVEIALFDELGHVIDQFVVPTDANGFLSTLWAPAPYDNLFALTGNLPARVRVRVPDGVTNQAATLRQVLKKGELAVAVLPNYRADGNTRLALGTFFPVALGSYERATLLVANLWGSDLTVDLFQGLKGPDGSGFQGNPRLKNQSFWIVDIDPAAAQSHLIVSSTGNIVAQLVVETGRDTIHGVTLVPPF